MPREIKLDQPVRLRFLRDETFHYRNYAKDERPLQWFYEREASALISSGAAEIDGDAPTWDQAQRDEVEKGRSLPPPQAAGDPFGSKFAIEERKREQARAGETVAPPPVVDRRKTEK